MARRRSRAKKSSSTSEDGLVGVIRASNESSGSRNPRDLQTLPSALSTQRLARSQSKISELIDHAHQHVELVVRLCDGDDDAYLGNGDWPSLTDAAQKNGAAAVTSSSTKTSVAKKLLQSLLRKKQTVTRLVPFSRKTHDDARYNRLQQGYAALQQHLADTETGRKQLEESLTTFRMRALAMESVLPPEPRESHVMMTSLHACFAQSADLIDELMNTLTGEVAAQTQTKIDQLTTFKATLAHRDRLKHDLDVAKQQLEQFQKLSLKQRSAIPGAYDLELAQRKHEARSHNSHFALYTHQPTNYLSCGTAVQRAASSRGCAHCRDGARLPVLRAPRPLHCRPGNEFVLFLAAISASVGGFQGAQSSSSDSRVACSPEDVLWFWKGALTPQSVTFKMGLRDGHRCKDRDFILHAFPELESDSEKPHSTLTMCLSVGDGSDEFAQAKTCELEHLPYPDRRYNYVLSFVPADKSTPNAVVQRGTFHTPPLDGEPFNFRFAMSSCADEDSDPAVFHDMKRQDPFLFLHMGDLHYHNIDVHDVTKFRNAYHSMFTSPAGRAMLEMDLPFAYMWDDHDYGPDNSDKTAPGRNASVQVYREFVPHYPLPGDGPLSAVYQAFTIGRVRFILTDLRSERTPNLAPDVPSKTVLGAKQKKWFKEELVRATQDPHIGMIVWCSTMPWHDDERKWGYFTFEQKELINYMTAHGVNRWKPVVIVSGDAHMLAIDDGSFTPGNMTLFHAAALGRPGSVKGGPYSHGAMPGSGQYGIVDVRDDGKKVCLHFQGIRTGEGVLMEYDTCKPETTPSNGTFYPPPIPIRQLARALKKAKKQAPQILLGLALSSGVILLVWQFFRKRAAAQIKKNR